MPTGKLQTCATCLFWQFQTKSGRGQCRRQPPSIPQKGWGSVWPTTAHYDWCGSWEPVARRRDPIETMTRDLLVSPPKAWWSR